MSATVSVDGNRVFDHIAHFVFIDVSCSSTVVALSIFLCTQRAEHILATSLLGLYISLQTVTSFVMSFDPVSSCHVELYAPVSMVL